MKKDLIATKLIKKVDFIIPIWSESVYSAKCFMLGIESSRQPSKKKTTEALGWGL